MKTAEREKLSNIIDELWQLHQETKDVTAQGQIKTARATLLLLWGETNDEEDASNTSHPDSRFDDRRGRFGR